MMKTLPIRSHKRNRQQKLALKYASLLAVVVLLGTGAVFLLGSANAMGTKSATDFARKAAVGNEFEIESSNLALQKSQDENIRHFAQQMVGDHGKAGDDLATTVANANMEKPDATLDRKHQKMLDKLNAASGTEFDHAYIKAQVKAHDEAVSLFKDYAKHGSNDDLKNFASSTLPTLNEHKQKIDAMKSSYSSSF